MKKASFGIITIGIFAAALVLAACNVTWFGPVIPKMPTEDMGPYTVTFDTHGHGTGDPQSQKVAQYDRASKPTVNAPTGWVFCGWFTEKLCKTEWDFNMNIVTGNITLYAKWDIEDPHGIVMADIPAGGFTMGDNGIITGVAQEHYVTLSAFKIAQTEVTQAQWQAVMGNNPSSNINDQHPVVQVNCYAAMAFCNKLSIETGLDPVYSVNGISDWAGLAYGSIPTTNNADWNAAIMDMTKNGYRMPTEAEWEYACRAGTTTAYNNGRDDITDSEANFDINFGSTTQVGKYPANAWGLFDMHGNVWEWCWNYWSGPAGYGPDDKGDNPIGPSSGSGRVIRGGSWYNNVSDLCAGFRQPGGQFGRTDDIGFRIVRRWYQR